MRQNPKPYELYRHFKGEIYQILNLAKHSETGETLVIYQGLYGECPIYARPLEMFMEKTDKVKYPEAEQEYRFEAVKSVGKCGEEHSALPEKGIAGKLTAETIAAEKPAAEKTTAETIAAEKPGAEISAAETMTEEEQQLDPMVLAFLDADSYQRKLEILAGLELRITDDMITTMAIACDVEVPEGSVAERYRGLRNCLVTLDKYECNRLR